MLMDESLVLPCFSAGLINEIRVLTPHPAKVGRNYRDVVYRELPSSYTVITFSSGEKLLITAALSSTQQQRQCICSQGSLDTHYMKYRTSRTEV